jgi:hypothetical protein
MSAVYDLQILAEMADEIRKYKVPGLPASLRSCLTTKRGRDVGNLLEELAVNLLKQRFDKEDEISRLKVEIDGLRNEMQTLTDLSLGRTNVMDLDR